MKGEAGLNGTGRIGRIQECGREEGVLELLGAPEPGSPPLRRGAWRKAGQALSRDRVLLQWDPCPEGRTQAGRPGS